jgi:hypothetical protein
MVKKLKKTFFFRQLEISRTRGPLISAKRERALGDTEMD